MKKVKKVTLLMLLAAGLAAEVCVAPLGSSHEDQEMKSEPLPEVAERDTTANNAQIFITFFNQKIVLFS